MTKTVQYQNELHKFLIWDTAGQERVSHSLIYYVFFWGPKQIKIPTKLSMSLSFHVTHFSPMRQRHIYFHLRRPAFFFSIRATKSTDGESDNGHWGHFYTF
jgi:hypothetical protein